MNENETKDANVEDQAAFDVYLQLVSHASSLPIRHARVDTRVLKVLPFPVRSRPNLPSYDSILGLFAVL